MDRGRRNGSGRRSAAVLRAVAVLATLLGWAAATRAQDLPVPQDSPHRLPIPAAQPGEPRAESVPPPDGRVAWHVTGRVLSPDGTPVASAQVTFLPAITEQLTPEGSGWSAPGAWDSLLASLPRARTGADGRFALDALHPPADDAYGPILLRQVFRSRDAERRLAEFPWITPGPMAPSMSFHPQILVAARGLGAAGRFVSEWHGQADVGDIPLAPGQTLSGRLVGTDGRPFAGALVMLSGTFPPSANGRVTSERFPLSALSAGPLARTGPDGGFRLEGIPPGQPSLVLWTSEGVRLRLTHGPVVTSDSEKGPMELVAREVESPPSLPIAGRVLDEHDRPVAGAFVRVNDAGTYGRDKPGAWPLLLSDGTVPQPTGPAETLTDAEGRFRLLASPSWDGGPSVGLAVAAPGHAPVASTGEPLEATDVTLKLVAPAGLLLVSKDTESERTWRVLAGTALLSNLPEDEYGSQPAPVLVGPAALDAARAAGLPGIPEDLDPGACLFVIGVQGATASVQVQAQGAGTRMFWSKPLVSPGSLQVVEHPRGYTLNAWVSDGIRTAVPGARLELMMDWGRPQATLGGWTDAEGWLHLNDVYPTKYLVNIVAPGHVPVSGYEYSMSPAWAEGTYTFPEPTLGAIGGRLSLPEGEDPAGMTVRMAWHKPDLASWAPYWPPPSNEIAVLTGDDGRFLATGLPKGTWAVSTPLGGMQEVRLEWGCRETVDLQVGGPSVLRVRVVDARGEALACGLVLLDPATRAQLTDPKTHQPVYSVLHEDGRFEFTLAPPARCIIQACLPGLLHESEPVALEPDETREVEVRVPGLGGLEVLFLGDDGQPIPTAGLLLDGEYVGSGIRDGDLARYPVLPAGGHVLQAVGLATLWNVCKPRGIGLGPEVRVTIPNGRILPGVVLPAPRPGRVTLRWDRDLRPQEFLDVRAGFTSASKYYNADGNEPATSRSLSLDVLAGLCTVNVTLTTPKPGGTPESTSYDNLDLLEQDVDLANGEERMLFVHLP